MKIGKILMLVTIVSSLLGVSIYSVGAVEENVTITDGVGDVLDLMLGNAVDEHPGIDVKNIDITKLEYEREDKRTTLTLTVDGIIEDRGNISDISDFGMGGTSFDEFNINTVAYVFALTTSFESYQITYANNTCQLIYLTDFEIVNLTDDDFSVLGKTLTISFDLKTDNETYEDVSVQSFFQKFQFSIAELEQLGDDFEDWDDLLTFLSDEAPNQPIQADAFAPNLGEVGKPVEFEAFPSFGQPPYTYQWDFGDGTTSSEKSPTHIYEAQGEYEYTFTVTDNSGSSASYSDTIEIGGGGGDDEGSPLILFVVVIVIIAVIGIIALVYIIRR